MVNGNVMGKQIEQFKSTHNLTFYDAPDVGHIVCQMLFPDRPVQKWDVYRRYKIGTCHGLWKCKDKCYQILAVYNDKPGNGHFTDVLEIFENSAKRDGYSLLILELWNKNLEKHLIEKKGFKKVKKGCIKYFHEK